jgi:hypothetical protein
MTLLGFFGGAPRTVRRRSVELFVGLLAVFACMLEILDRVGFVHEHNVAFERGEDRQGGMRDKVTCTGVWLCLSQSV